MATGSIPSPYPPEEDVYLTPEEAQDFLDEWANKWNYPSLPKAKGLPPRKKVNE